MYVNTKKKHSYYLKKHLNENLHSKLVYGVELKHRQKLFNTIFVQTHNISKYRIKQKFVPMREFVPKIIENTFQIPSYFSKSKYDFTEKIKNEFGFIPFVCYESIFSIFTAKQAINSDFILLSSSESFMNNSYFGKKQYLNIVKLRAIENGRYILKCSNEGISCLIDQKGNIVKEIRTKVENTKIKIIKKNTFYQTIISNL